MLLTLDGIFDFRLLLRYMMGGVDIVRYEKLKEQKSTRWIMNFHEDGTGAAAPNGAIFVSVMSSFDRKCIHRCDWRLLTMRRPCVHQ